MGEHRGGSRQIGACIHVGMNTRKHKKRVICLDFDGVIHAHLLSWKDRQTVSSGVVDGVVEAIEQLRRSYVVKVHSGRCCEESGRQAIEDWLKVKGIEVDEVCKDKPQAYLYVDDRGIQFKGDWSQTIKDIEGFRQWQAEQKRQQKRGKIIRKRLRRGYSDET